MKNQINLADFVKVVNSNDNREGYIRKPEGEGDYGYWEQAHQLVDIYGNDLPYRFLPYYEGQLATKDEVIYLGNGENGWPALVEAYKQFEETGKPFTYHTFIPCAGNTVKVTQSDGKVMVNGKEVSHAIVSLEQAIERFSTLPKEIIGDLEEQYFLEAYRGLEDYPQDNYFHLLSRGGMMNVIRVAHNNGHTHIAETLQTWVDAGMTDLESRSVWLNSKKDSCYNHTYYWNGVTACYESYGLNSPRTKTICTITPEKIAEVRAQEVAEELARKEARKSKFDELSKAVTEKYSEEVLKIALKKKGQVLAVLTTLTNSQGELQLADIKKILQVAGTPAEITNLISFVSAGVLPGQAEKVAKKAYAWAYLCDAFPGIVFAGYFDDARNALEKYSKIWKPKVSKATFSLGELDSLHELREKLA